MQSSATFIPPTQPAVLNNDEKFLPKERINVCSFDFDGCLFNRDYLNKIIGPKVIRANVEFFEKIAKDLQCRHYNQVLLMVGSNRQCYSIDEWNAYNNKTELCFPQMR